MSTPATTTRSSITEYATSTAVLSERGKTRLDMSPNPAMYTRIENAKADTIPSRTVVRSECRSGPSEWPTTPPPARTNTTIAANPSTGGRKYAAIAAGGAEAPLPDSPPPDLHSSSPTSQLRQPATTSNRQQRDKP